MNLSRTFIDRPVTTALAMAALVLFGLFGYANLPVSDLPPVDFPTVQVDAILPGADPVTMASRIALPLESQFAAIGDIAAMTSQSRQGSTAITIQFDQNRNIDAAAQDVQNAVAAAAPMLPFMPPPAVHKVNPADQPILFITMTSRTITRQQLDEYAETLLARQLSTIDGVAQVQVLGQSKYAVRIEADPDALAARQIGIDTLSGALAGANATMPTGALNGEYQSSAIHVDGALENATAFANQIVAWRNGAPVRVRDVAVATDGFIDPYGGSWYNGQRDITLAVSRRPGSNTVAVADAIRNILPQFKAGLPTGVTLNVTFDKSRVIRNSVRYMQATLLVAGLLVVGVIFVFLRLMWATFIPSLAIPIAVIPTFAGMAALGFTLDDLSLMALTLSAGFVVDDAIVMLENIVRHIENGEKPYEAALNGASEIGFTILSMTVSVEAAFIPVLFMGGIVGRLLHEFAVTTIIAIGFSGLVSVTLTPMLCARFLKDEQSRPHHALYRWSEAAFRWLQTGYCRSLSWSLGHCRLIFGAFLLSIAATAALFLIMPQDFLPSGDTGLLEGQIQVADGTSFVQLYRYMDAVEAVIGNDPNVSGELLQVAGGGGPGDSNTIVINAILLKPGRRLSADAVLNELRDKLSRIPGVNVFLTNPPLIAIGERQARSSFQYTLVSLDPSQLRSASARLMAVLGRSPIFVGLNSDLEADAPAVSVSIDRDSAAALGVSVQQIESALSQAFSGQPVSFVATASGLYPVFIELQSKFRGQASALRRIYVTATGGTLVPIAAVAKISMSNQPLSINHSGLSPSVTLSFDLAPGYALSDAVKAIQAASVATGISGTVIGRFEGTAKAFEASTRDMIVLLIIALVVVYIVLGVLYESFIHPLTILSGLPSATMGALLTLFLARLPLTLYAFVGMIMLMGIVKKNAIMMIDFALVRQRDGGINAQRAIYDAAIIRFRPIMMTTAAAMMGALPIALGFGAGADSRRALGLCVVGGLLVSQLLTLYITPVIYIYLDGVGCYRRPRAIPVPAE